MKTLGIVIGIALLVCSATARAETEANMKEKNSETREVLFQKNMETAQLSRRLDELKRVVENLERKLDRLDGRINLLNNDVKELKRRL